MKTFLLAAGVLLAASAVPALAQDAAPSTTSSFTGPRAEIFGGWDRLGTRWRTTGPADDYTVNTHQDGFTGGAQLGYDIPLGDRLVAGAFGSYSLSTARSCLPTGGCIKDGREIEGGVRLGTKFLGDKALGYVKGAYVNGRIRDTGDGLSTDRNAWRAGAGVEYALAPHVYTKIEYDYTKSDTFHYVTDAGDNSLRYDRNQVLAGFGIRF